MPHSYLIAQTTGTLNPVLSWDLLQFSNCHQIQCSCLRLTFSLHHHSAKSHHNSAIYFQLKGDYSFNYYLLVENKWCFVFAVPFNYYHHPSPIAFARSVIKLIQIFSNLFDNTMKDEHGPHKPKCNETDDYRHLIDCIFHLNKILKYDIAAHCADFRVPTNKTNAMPTFLGAHLLNIYGYEWKFRPCGSTVGNCFAHNEFRREERRRN